MMSYQIKIDPKSRKAARFISQLQKKIQKALVASGMTQQEVAEILDVDRSVINRRLKSSANLTARTISDFAYAFDKDVVIEFVDRTPADRVNHQVSTGSITGVQEKASSSTGTLRPDVKFNLESAAS